MQGHGRKSTKVRVNGQAHKSIGVRTEEQCHKGNGTEIKGKVTVAKSKTQKKGHRGQSTWAATQGQEKRG